MSLRTGPVISAHGIVGGRADLPVPSWLSIYASAIAVAVSFYVVAALWSSPRFVAVRGISLQRVGRLVDSRGVTVAARVVGLVALAITVSAAFIGPDDRGVQNPAPTWFYVWFWVGLVPASLVCGPIWRRLNPSRSLAAALRTVLHVRVRELPARLRYWPAVGGLIAFGWLELVYDDAASPRVVGTFITGYLALQTIAGAVFAEAWFRRCDTFEVVSTVVSYASPLGRDGDGRLVLRNPLVGIASAPTEPSLAPIVIVMLATTAFDGVERTSWWAGRVAGTARARFLLDGTAGLLAVIALVALTYWSATRAMRLHDRSARSSGQMAPSLIPIVIGYAFAHYFSFAVFQGQQGVLLANDPFVHGWNLFGLRGDFVDYTVVSANTIAAVQIGAIVLGHVVAVISAHDRAVGILDGRHVRSGQYAMVAVMVGYTAAGIALLAGA